MKHKTTRRDFLKKAGGIAAGTLAAPMIIPSTALGSGAVPPPSERVNLGYVGVGGRGNALAYQFLRVPEAQSLAVCDAKQTRLDSTAAAVDDFYAKRDGKGITRGCAKYGDFRELLQREEIDAVVIATPDHWHVPVALAAVRAGKDVYVEKPLSTAVSWNREMRAAVKRYGAVFQYGTQQRSDRKFRKACELVRNGYIGILQRIEAWCPGMAAPGGYEKTSKDGGSVTPMPVPPGLDYEMWLGPAPWSPYTRDRCTQWGSYHVYDNALGFIAGWGAHPLDIALWGKSADPEAPLFYEGTGKIPDQGIFDTISDWDVHARFADGVTLHFMNTKTANPVVSTYRPFTGHGTTFFGTEGWVSVDRGKLYASDPALLNVKLPAGAVRLYESDHHQGNFIECVRTRRPTVSPVEAAFQSDLISHLSDITIRTGRPLTWDPDRETIAGDPSAARMLHRALRSPWRL